MSLDRTTLAEEIRRLTAAATIEATPKAVASTEPLAELLGQGRSVYIPFLPRAAFADTVAACRCLVRAGLRPVPHVAARAVANRGELNDWLARLAEAGAGSLLLIGGDPERPRGPFWSAQSILETGLLAQHGFRRIGVGGHPEGHPQIETATLWRALERKATYARETGTQLWLVSQFAFEAAPIVAWLRDVRDTDVEIPVWVGIPGPAKLRTLLGYALRCGIGATARAVTQRPGAALRLAERWTPDALLGELARHSLADPSLPIAGVHIFPFGGLRGSVKWLDAMREPPIETAAAVGAGGAQP